MANDVASLSGCTVGEWAWKYVAYAQSRIVPSWKWCFSSSGVAIVQAERDAGVG